MSRQSHFPHKVTIKHSDNNLGDILEWLYDNTKERWTYVNHNPYMVWYFMDVTEAIHFKLRWHG